MQEGNLSWAASVILISNNMAVHLAPRCYRSSLLIIGFAPTGRAAAMMM